MICTANILGDEREIGQKPYDLMNLMRWGWG